ncbi:MAG: aminotransferase class I/II-fold pyridoxal phosphate-dependent enzyme [Euryarchaeota archaeon]|nr:aminotransferase class I/II-fold pyridoxal phosphate-dependent enzyme [Euryarchaeota archaeon]
MEHIIMLPLKNNILTLEPSTHGSLIRMTSQMYDIPESEILDLSANLNPLGSPFDNQEGGPDVNQEYGLDMDELMQRSLETIGHYPDNRYMEFRRSAAHFVDMGVKAQHIVAGNGSCEIIRLVTECVLEEGDMVLIPQPTFAEYEQQSRIAGAVIRHHPLEYMFNIPTDLLTDVKIVFVCNPNNPTGELIPRSKLIELADRCAASDTLLFVDEAFIELADPEQSIADVAASNDHVFVLRSLTKDFALPGIRVGFGVTSVAMADALNTARLSWNLGSLPDVVGCALLGMEGGCNSPYLIESREFIRTEREYLIERLSDIYGFEPMPSSVNYVLVDVSGLLMDSVELTQRLASHGILVRDCSSFYSYNEEHAEMATRPHGCCSPASLQDIHDKDYIRVAVRPRQETDRLITIIGEVLTESGKEYAEEKLKQTIENASSGTPSSRNTCEYYPCHFQGQDCTFCFCPFYPCEDEATGGRWIDSTTGGKVWSCEGCTIVHHPDVVHQILDILMEEGTTEDNLAKAWKEVIVPRLLHSSFQEY